VYRGAHEKLANARSPSDKTFSSLINLTRVIRLLDAVPIYDLVVTRDLARALVILSSC